MPWIVRSCAWRWAAALAMAAAACGHPSSAGDDAGAGDAGMDDGRVFPGFDVLPPTGLFPLGVAADGSSLVTADGAPFLLHGEAAWSLIAQLSTSNAMRYLTDRRARGVNLVLVNLIEHKFATSAPRNAAGDAPFTTPGDFSTPNEAYFAHADQIIDLAASQGISVLLTPSYLGYAGTDEGWSAEMNTMGMAGAPKCNTYGSFVGQRYATKKNIIWLWGGDTTPGTGSPVETCMKAIRDRIVEAGGSGPGRALTSAHWDHPFDSLVEPTFAAALDLVGVYTYDPVLPLCRTARMASPRRPTYLLETTYEHEHSATTADVRRQQWSGWLGCGAGEIVGNNPMWLFGSGWPQQLASPVSLDEVRLLAIAQRVPWQTLALDDALVSSRGSGLAEIVATRSSDHKQAMIYIPPAGAQTITVDLTHMAGAVTATWIDPTADKSTAAGTGLSGSQTFTTPGKNNGGDPDWVLQLTVP